MRENCRDATVELRVYEANASDTDNAKVRAEAKEPVDGDLVLKIEFILLDGAIVPDAHYQHEDEGEDNWDPGFLPVCRGPNGPGSASGIRPDLQLAEEIETALHPPIIQSVQWGGGVSRSD